MGGKSVTVRAPANGWQPPPRPEWVRKVIQEGHCMDIRGIVPLDEPSLLQTAMRNTGLSDFGSDEWREPLGVLIGALESEAELHLIGRLRARMEILLQLEARLRVEDTYKRHPEIDEQVIDRPLIILGQGRCGSTFLQGVLGANPDDGTPRQWEMMFPCPPPEKATYWTDPRIAAADKIASQWQRIQPEIQGMMPFAGLLPFEDLQIYSMTFMSAGWLGMLGEVPTYEAYVGKQDPKVALNCHKRVLKLLQWKNPRRHWVLKDVHHLWWTRELLEVYPDARLTWIHRDPVRAMASMRSILGTLQRCGAERTFKYGDTVQEFLLNPVSVFEHLMEQIDAGAVPADRIHHMQYLDLLRDKLGTLAAMYRYHGIELTDAGRNGIERYLAEHPREARPPHEFPLPSGAELARLRKVCKRYQERFKVPDEV